MTQDTEQQMEVTRLFFISNLFSWKCWLMWDPLLCFYTTMLIMLYGQI